MSLVRNTFKLIFVSQLYVFFVSASQAPFLAGVGDEDPFVSSMYAIAPVPNKGVGVIARRNIKKGDTIMIEKPLLDVPGPELTRITGMNASNWFIFDQLRQRHGSEEKAKAIKFQLLSSLHDSESRKYGGQAPEDSWVTLDRRELLAPGRPGSLVPGLAEAWLQSTDPFFGGKMGDSYSTEEAVTLASNFVQSLRKAFEGKVHIDEDGNGWISWSMYLKSANLPDFSLNPGELGLQDAILLWKQVAKTLTGVLLTNALGSTEGNMRLFLNLSKFNHSCEPNAGWQQVVTSDVSNVVPYSELPVIALRDISIGEEITVSYIDNSLTRKDRHKKLLDGWGRGDVFFQLSGNSSLQV